jgi:hypothetical protein
MYRILPNQAAMLYILLDLFDLEESSNSGGCALHHIQLV